VSRAVIPRMTHDRPPFGGWWPTLRRMRPAAADRR
jgi:hypothetical protein